MPNYCYQSLKVISNNTEKSKSEYQKFKLENLKDTEGDGILRLTFSGITPMPDKIILSNKEKTIFKKLMGKITKSDPDWYVWSYVNWGCKWDASTNKIKEEKGQLIIYYETAWVLPDPWLNKIADRYKHLDFELDFSEEGGFFDGDAITTRGEWEFNISEPAKWLEEVKENEKK